ncbi:MAG: sugar porter family MFS transporter [Cytophagaceae bacterium]
MKNHLIYSILIALVVSLGGFLLGFDGAVISGAVPFYRVSLNLADNPILLGLSVSSIVGGSIIGNFIAGALSDKLGRKPALLITSILFVLGALGTALANDISIFIISRIIGGLGVGIAILVAPVYIAEIAPPAQRGKLVTFNQLNIVLGLSSAYFSNYFILKLVENPELNWRWMLGIALIPAVAYFLLLLLIPESPRWLIQKGREEEGVAVLKKAGGDIHAQSEFEKIKRSITNSSNKLRPGFTELFSTNMRFVLMIGLALAFFQQISGINAVLYYAPLIFETAGGGRDSAFLQSVILGVVFIAGTIVSMFLIDRLGRKPLLLAGISLMAASLMVVGYSFHKATYTITEKSITDISSAVQKESILGEMENIRLYNAFSEIKNQQFNSELLFFNNIKALMYSNNISNVGEKFESIKAIILNNSISINAFIVLAGILGFIIGFSISLGPVMWTMLSEIFPNRYRGMAISVAGTFNAITSFFVASIFPVELDYLGSALTYFIFAGFMIIAILFVWKFVPETKGMSLEEIEKKLVPGLTPIKDTEELDIPVYAH